MKNRDLCSSLVTAGLTFSFVVASLLNSLYVVVLKQIEVTREFDMKAEKTDYN